MEYCAKYRVKLESCLLFSTKTFWKFTFSTVYDDFPSVLHEKRLIEGEMGIWEYNKVNELT